MKTVQTQADIPRDAIRADLRADGSWLVYMLGDQLPEIAAAPEAVTLTAQQFRDRFTDAELAAMVSSADTGVKLLVLKVQTADPFTMDNATVQAGLDYLQSKGILTAERRAVIGSLT
jgi:hypothetical protein